MQFPRLVMPSNDRTPHLEPAPRTFKLYFVLPPGVCTRDGYTPQVVVSLQCASKTIRSIITNSLPPLPKAHSVEFFCYSVPPQAGCYLMGPVNSHPVLLESNLGHIGGDSIIVSVKVLDEERGCMVQIDPFPHPAYPPRILTWSPSCD